MAQKGVTMSKVITARQAVDMVQDGATLALTGFVSFGLPEELLVEMEKKFLEEGHPKNLFTFFAAGIAGDGKTRGLNHFSHDGMIGKLYGGNNSMAPVMGEYIASNKFPAYMAPQGVISHLMRAIAAGEPGVLTHSGLKTFCDPRVEGCQINDKCKEEPEEFVQLMHINGQECLFYRAFPIDVCFIKVTSVDEAGNASIEHEAVHIEQFELAAATHNSGGIVILQADRLVKKGSIPARQVVVPSFLVDYIVIGSPENSRQHYSPDETPYVGSWTGEVKVPLSSIPRLPLNVRKVCARRALLELKPGGVTNLGAGMPTNIAAVANEENLTEQIILSMESGATGGVLASGLCSGASYNPDAILKQPDLFDFYGGGGIDVAYLGLAEADVHGNVNVSKFGGRVTGPGGFIDITQNAKKVCFLGTFTAGKSDIKIENGEVHILAESGKVKFKEAVEQITFSGEYSRENDKQNVLFITERAVFALEKDGLALIEIAPGVDLKTDILDLMEFKPRVSEDLKQMDARIFRDEPMQLSVAELQKNLK